MQKKEIIIDIKNLVKHYKTGNVITKAVNGVSFKVFKGEFIAIMGPSGSGKSTILHQLALLDEATTGSITIKVAVTDGLLSVSDEFELTIVMENVSPTLDSAIADQSVNVNEAMSYAFPADTFSDVNSDTLTYEAALSGGETWPSWLDFERSTRTFSGTPTSIETITIVVTASDGSLTVTDTFEIDIHKSSADSFPSDTQVGLPAAVTTTP